MEYFRNSGYDFVGPADVKGLDPNGRYVFIGFDDGYCNNIRSIPVLDEFDVPATFFISTNHILKQKSFWWDVLHRERMARGANLREVYLESQLLKKLTNRQIEERLVSEFGESALKPRGDLDRAFRSEELREFTKHRLVHLGNHTADHAILPNYGPEVAKRQVRDAQEVLREISGTAPIAIAYPNGAVNELVETICRGEGLSVGFTMKPFKNRIARSRNMALGRFAIEDEKELDRQCEGFRSDLQFYGLLRSAYIRLFRKEALN